jgi:hypothetical protein
VCGAVLGEAPREGEVVRSNPRNREAHDFHAKNAATCRILPAILACIKGIIKYKGVIWLGHSPELQTKVTDQLHSSPIGGHSGLLGSW